MLNKQLQDIPQGGKLCGFSLSGSNESFYFDDELMLLLNDIPLIGSVNFAVILSQWMVYRDTIGLEFVVCTTELGEATCIDGATDCLIPN